MYLLSRGRRTLAAASLVLALCAGVATAAPALASPSTTHSVVHVADTAAPKPTIVLVHGAWADSSSWAPVTLALQAAGYPVLVAPNNLRSLSDDAARVAAFINQRTSGPVILVGHSYGGAVVTDAALAAPRVKALVYVDAFIPDQGESLSSIVAGSTSALNVNPTTVFDIVGYPGAPAGDADVYLKNSTFAQSFAQDVSAPIREELDASQLPITLTALAQPSTTPAWKTLPSYAVVGTQDRVLPLATQLAEATRAGATITQVTAGHLSMISKPLQVTATIIRAARDAN